MEGMEDGVTRPRQVRYQAALRPDFIHNTPLPDCAQLLSNRVLTQRTCYWVGLVDAVSRRMLTEIA